VTDFQLLLPAVAGLGKKVAKNYIKPFLDESHHFLLNWCKFTIFRNVAFQLSNIFNP